MQYRTLLLLRESPYHIVMTINSESLPASIGHRPTSYDVAELAGVSQSAVSRCYTPGSKASPAMRARVLAAAEKLGYRPNAIARGLTTGRSRLIAVIVTEQSSAAYPELLFEFTSSFGKRGVRLAPVAMQSGHVDKAALEPLWSHQFEGVVVAMHLPDDIIAMLKRRGLEVVLYNRASDTLPVSAVMCDHRECGRRLARLLLEAGHRRFGFIEAPLDGAVGIERLAGAQEQIEREPKAEIVRIRGDYSYTSGGDAAEELWKRRGPKLSAIVAANDLMAIGAMDRLRLELGIRIPEDISVVGFDGIGPGLWASYNLTTVRQPLRQMAEVTAELMLGRIADPDAPAEKRLFSGELVKGSSARLE
jgi:DNA-binding LacI/PurR family transcriptional regulator